MNKKTNCFYVGRRRCRPVNLLTGFAHEATRVTALLRFHPRSLPTLSEATGEAASSKAVTVRMQRYMGEQFRSHLVMDLIPNKRINQSMKYDIMLFRDCESQQMHTFY